MRRPTNPPAQIHHLPKTFGTLPAAAITRKQVSDCMAKRATETAKGETVRAECAYLKRMLRLACASFRSA